ncbi:hypothetical protein [Caballeronia sordidicola]|uniref:Uncharacterized protein n=1 Tax=Caballeronia sordidicola TaxID=196367 RepID=A0A226WMK1_CABSO|nr:hypothetical protein [Caballeronia sordidicola]OXC72029.1 hypothetical protein BSU04_44050 [Caballeronia sordidicola]
MTRQPARFALTAGRGDVLIGVTALPVAYLAAIKGPAWRTSTWFGTRWVLSIWYSLSHWVSVPRTVSPTKRRPRRALF